jgi:hypothetical protein
MKRVVFTILVILVLSGGAGRLLAHHSFAAESPTAISYTITIDDPKIFTAPWSQEFEIIAKPEWEKDGLFEYVCQENNRCPGGKCGGEK